MTAIPLVPTVATVDEVGFLELLRVGPDDPPDMIIGGSFAVLGLARAANASAVRVGRVAARVITGTGGGGGGENVKGAGALVLGRGGVVVD